jgi:enoyl-CoA hydratase/carnithine racemase
MSYGDITYEVSDAIATITLHRPQTLNAWTARMDQEVRHAMLAAHSDPAVKVIILTGSGRGFCSGADMGLLSSIAGGGGINADENITSGADGSSLPSAREDYRQQYSYFPAIDKPIIGAINGAAAGLGFVLMLYCDIRFASEQVKLTTTFARRGLIAEYGLAWMLPRVVGMTHAMDLMLSGRTILADEALRMGLVSRVFPEASFAQEVRKYALDIAQKASPRSTRVIKRMAYESPFQSLKEALDLALTEMMESIQSEDFREGVAHYLEKREPKFTGK